MNNFVYQNPTKIIFGRDTQKEVGAEIKKHGGHRVLIHFGSNRTKNSGLYDEVVASLEAQGLEHFDLGGVVPNPRLSLIYEGIKLVKENNIDFILAIGGGSVIDSGKAIAGGAANDNDVWDYFEQGKPCTNSLPLATILTLPATASEMNGRCVVTKDDTQEKRGTIFPNPTFSILNAELCATVPKNQVANGAVDMFSHCFERYFTNTENVEITDRLLEGNMKAIVSLAADVYANPSDYEKYAQLMWAGTMAHNFILDVGRVTDFASHQIEHEMSGMYDVAHGAGLAVVMPAWLKYVYKHDPARVAMFGVNVFGVESDYMDLERTALKAIEAMENWFKTLDMPLKLNDLDIPESAIKQLATNTTRNGKITQGNFVKLDTQAVEEILKLAL